MKSKNILADIKSKSLKETKEEINKILKKLEKNEANLDNSKDDYLRLVRLNSHMDVLFKKKFKEISASLKKIKKK
jgi:exonuclease VII small subunit|tara:strand:- start:5 stop:229 length:225 start_codon:yes stop_codon:yes gene_type:complete